MAVLKAVLAAAQQLFIFAKSALDMAETSFRLHLVQTPHEGHCIAACA